MKIHRLNASSPNRSVVSELLSLALVALLLLPFVGLATPGVTGSPLTFHAHAAAVPLTAATYVVDTSADAGSLIDCTDKAKRCTLRDAIQKANANDGDDTIAFAIPESDPRCGAGRCTILLSTALPDLTTNINIQGPARSI
jgi:hypothetical protein